MNAADLRESLGSLPIFPLGACVLLPGAVMPLHIFEPRHRALLADAMAADGLFGIATVVGADIFPVMGVGQVVAHESLPDGRSHILLQHVAVARVVEELPQTYGYRRVKAEVVEIATGVHDTARVKGIRVLLHQLAMHFPRAGEDVKTLMELPEPELVNALGRRLLGGVRDQLTFLSAGSAAERMTMVEGALATLLAAGSEPSSFDA